MSNQKPPRMARDERMTLSALLPISVNLSSGRSPTSMMTRRGEHSLAVARRLLWLTKHLSRAEVIWVLRRFSGADVEIPYDTVHPEDTVTSAVEAYRATWTRVDDVVLGAGLEEVCRGVGGEPAINLRWVLMHLLEETARHAGHADILRELIDGATGR